MWLTINYYYLTTDSSPRNHNCGCKGNVRTLLQQVLINLSVGI